MMSFAEAQSYHSGEEQMHTRLKLPPRDNPTVPGLSQQLAFALQTFPLLAVGALDADDRPWVSVWGGETGFARAIGNGMVGVRTPVEASHDPVIDALIGKSNAEGGIVRAEGNGKLMAGLTIDLMTRKRVKLAGRMLAGGLSDLMDEEESTASDGPENNGSYKMREVQLVIKIDESLGNCPKYLNRKEISPSIPKPVVVPQGTPGQLADEAIALIARSDMFFMSSHNNKQSMDVNHRGGPPGFVRVLPALSTSIDKAPCTSLVYPEYSGNRLYQTLGNLINTPQVGLVFPDFATGDVLYLTGQAAILVGQDAASIISRSNLAVKVDITAAIHVRRGLPFRGNAPANGMSPYNPSVRRAVGEAGVLSSTTSTKDDITSQKATLVFKTIITPTISRYKFEVKSPSPSSPLPLWTPGQYVALDFSEELDIGYSHMRDDDPRSLNDDFIRTFTVSNAPQKPERETLSFEITVRSTGRNVTQFLSSQNARSGFEVGFKGFAGDFAIKRPGDEEKIVPFIAGGIGITPLMAAIAAKSVEVDQIRLLWSLRASDLNLVVDVLGSADAEGMARGTTVFVTGELGDKQRGILDDLEKRGVTVLLRRPIETDLVDLKGQFETFYLCAGKQLRDQALAWLPDEKVEYENFDY